MRTLAAVVLVLNLAGCSTTGSQPVHLEAGYAAALEDSIQVLHDEILAAQLETLDCEDRLLDCKDQRWRDGWDATADRARGAPLWRKALAGAILGAALAYEQWAFASGVAVTGFLFSF